MKSVTLFPCLQVLCCSIKNIIFPVGYAFHSRTYHDIGLDSYANEFGTIAKEVALGADVTHATAWQGKEHWLTGTASARLT